MRYSSSSPWLFPTRPSRPSKTETQTHALSYLCSTQFHNNRASFPNHHPIRFLFNFGSSFPRLVSPWLSCLAVPVFLAVSVAAFSFAAAPDAFFVEEVSPGGELSPPTVPPPMFTLLNSTKSSVVPCVFYSAKTSFSSRFPRSQHGISSSLFHVRATVAIVNTLRV